MCWTPCKGSCFWQEQSRSWELRWKQGRDLAKPWGGDHLFLIATEGPLLTLSQQTRSSMAEKIYSPNKAWRLFVSCLSSR